MRDHYPALRVEEQGLQTPSLLNLPVKDLLPGQVQIEVSYSSLNYKDALALTGRGKILRHYPCVPGIDAAGLVTRSRDPRYPEGTAVLVTGCGLGEVQDGGFAGQVTVPGEWVIPLPPALSAREAMILGTAGFTVGLCLARFASSGQSPELGPMLVTGASGGVGSLAVSMLAKLGYEVWAVSGKPEAELQLMKRGATKVMRPDELQLGKRPLESVRFGGAIDNVGGAMLEGILRHIQPWGNVALVGLAGGSDFVGSAMPFILRGVSLLGISSTNCPYPLRKSIWQELAGAWRPQELESFVTQELTLAELPEAAERLLDRRSMGRTLVRLR